MIMFLSIRKSILASLVTTTCLAQAPSVPPLAGSLTFIVAGGNCSPATATTSAGRNAILVKLSSSKAQKIALVSTSSDRRQFFAHEQQGSAENWTASVMLPAGSYELVSSLHGSNCSVNVN